MELAVIIVCVLIALTLAYKLVKGVIGLAIKLAIIGIGLWLLNNFKTDIFG